ncbi:MAG: hypothetical protein HOO86_07845 [Bacteroidales bacterium]|nr:hypothetical protein [Bacteroidales bacterium]
MNKLILIVRLTLILTGLLFVTPTLIAQQVDSISNSLTKTLIDRIEQMSEDTENVYDYGELVDEYLYYVENPININSDKIEILRELKVLSNYQYEKLVEYLQNYGSVLSVFELNSIEGFDNQTIELIRPIITTNEIIGNDKIDLKKAIRWGRHQVFVRTEQVLEKSNGYKTIEDSILAQKPNSSYIGSPQKLYFKYAYNYRNRIRAGITTEKDAGEALIRNQVPGVQRELLGNKLKNGFDFYSAHLFLSDFGILKSLAIGDYHLAFGQGLTMWSGLSFGKSGSTTDIIKFGQGLKPSASVNENRFLRGGAFTLKYKVFDLTLFYSNKQFDGNITAGDSLTGDQEFISGIQESGLHRTVDELLDKAAIRQEMFGGHVSYQNKFMQLGYTAQQNSFKAELHPRISPYNQFSSLENTEFNQGVDLKVFLPKIVLFSEVALTQGGGMATIAGITAQPVNFASLTIAYRNFDKDYRNFYATSFGESSTPNNEIGTYLGLTADLTASLKLTSYADYFKFPWLRFQTDAPSMGHDYFVQLGHRINRTDDLYLRFRTKTKMTNQNDPWNYIDLPVEYTKTSMRFHINYKVSDALEFKDRAEIIQYDEPGEATSQGFIIFHDVVYKPVNKPHEFAFRFAVFDAESYDSRLYAYENDVLYAFSIPSFNDKGSRVYLLYRLKAIESVDLWVRIAQTWYDDKNEIGSGLDLIEGNKKTEIKLQIRWKF